MARSSPGVGRVAAILNFMADHPGQPFALTDLVRALKLSRATCHALLTGLVEVGYLYRASDKTYVLGPALARIGQTAAAHFSPLQVAQPEMRALADEFDVVCGAYFLEGETVHLRDRAASLSHVGYPIPLGNRIPLRTTLASAFFAFAPEDAEGWLASRQTPPLPEKAEAMRAGMAFARSYGFVAIARGAESVEGAQTLEAMFAPPGTAFPFDPLGAVEPGLAYPIVALFAPVVDDRNKAIMVLGMAGFSGLVPGDRALAMGARLRAACLRISEFVTGRKA